MTPLAAIAVCAALAGARTPPPPPESPPAASPGTPREHWAIALGRRVEQVDRAFPVVDRVVLVPDAATYLDELSRWSPRGRWPVLIEDHHFAPLFIRRFAPARVVRRAPVDATVTEPEIEAAVVRAWGGDPGAESPADVFARRRHVPAGIVIASAGDPAWTAAAAIAAGRGQPIAWLHDGFGRPNQTLDAGRLGELRAAVDGLVRASGYAFETLGDEIDALTLCREVAGRVELGPGRGAAEILALTDVLGRNAAGRRWAFTGWIFGDEVRCAYVAMSSLFLDRSRFMLFNTYREPQVNAVFGTDRARAVLQARGFEAATYEGESTTKTAWLNLLPGGLAADVLVMNSSGNSTSFHLADDRAYCGDVPTLTVPLALHFTHSFSMKAPASVDTVGGRWLTRGVYAYVGSVDEPRLSGFVPPAPFADRCATLVPFLVAGRKWDGGPPWKITTFGDPLMTCGAPPALGAPRPPRVAPPAGDPDAGLDLREHAKTLMRRAAADPGDAAALAEAIETLDLLGEDGIVIDMWRLAREREAEGAAAGPAFGALFRARLAGEVVRAWSNLSARDLAATDMLWQVMTPRLRAADEDALIALQASVRDVQADEDLRRLAPHLTATFGVAHTRAVIQREINRTSNPRRRRNLQKLLP